MMMTCLRHDGCETQMLTSHLSSDLRHIRCPRCLRAFELGSEPLPCPFVPTGDFACAIIVKPSRGTFLQYRIGDDLHIGISDGSSIVHSFWLSGIRSEKTVWDNSAVVCRFTTNKQRFEQALVSFVNRNSNRFLAEPSKVICPGKCFQPPCAQRERCTPCERNGNEEEKERSEGDNCSQWSHYVNSSSGSESSGAEELGDGPRGGWTVRERTDFNIIDEGYVEYHEYLCQGIHKLLESGITLEAECDLRPSSLTILQSAMCRALNSRYYYRHNLGPEIGSCKVFVGGLPIDIEEGYVFLIFDHESSVRSLVQYCTTEEDKLFLFINSLFNKGKLKVQIRLWRLADADYLVDVNAPINLRRVIFVGGVPRPIRAGAGLMAFINYNSYMKAITQRYTQLSHGEVEKRLCSRNEAVCIGRSDL
ncbi:p21-activated kinase 1 [Parelaphostrongylus tenuis]|uniref:P21-activated kinase 1 n=1 Tax=Parelaphostrongylus tenuis TaxID=148309 RepID=A0AAD5QRR9_PARTN|nr:p21-activated kinase 1 [Parelaphostrongylus tenuis]